jgi:cytochrome c oxidase subunit I+III
VAAWIVAFGLYQWLARAPVAVTSHARLVATVLVVSATVLVIAGSVASIAGHAFAGLAPRADAWSASAATLVGFQALYAVLVAIMACYLVARIWSGRLEARACATQDNVLLLSKYGAIQGIATVLLVQALPAMMTWRFG